MFTWSKPLKVDWPRVNTSLCYNFHKGMGHAAESCRKVKKDIHNLIQKG